MFCSLKLPLYICFIINTKTNIMKTYRFTIYFSDNDVKDFYSLSIVQASILGMAYKIQKNEDFSIDSIEDEKGIHYEQVDYIRFEKIVNV